MFLFHTSKSRWHQPLIPDICLHGSHRKHFFCCTGCLSIGVGWCKLCDYWRVHNQLCVMSKMLFSSFKINLMHIMYHIAMLNSITFNNVLPSLKEMTICLPELGYQITFLYTCSPLWYALLNAYFHFHVFPISVQLIITDSLFVQICSHHERYWISVCKPVHTQALCKGWLHQQIQNPFSNFKHWNPFSFPCTKLPFQTTQKLQKRQKVSLFCCTKDFSHMITHTWQI